MFVCAGLTASARSLTLLLLNQNCLFIDKLGFLLTVFIPHFAMEKVWYNRRVVTLNAVKRNVRLMEEDDTFDDLLTDKLDAAIAATSNFIGRDLRTIYELIGPFQSEVTLERDRCVHITKVRVNATDVLVTQWCYAEGKLIIRGEYPDDATLRIIFEYNQDIINAVLMHASALFLNPADSVEALPRASQNLLRAYRYG